ncbi:MAG: formate C-acetyltransferase [Acidobacteria bacterium]|nr:formate C-acetyltransferase [Acidobacteriota bacterium]
MNQRIQSLMAALGNARHPICIEKLRIALGTMAETEGEPMILRRAKVFANVLREIPIFIEEDTLIAGSGASRPMGLEIDPEYFLWSQDEIDALKREGFLISSEDERELQHLNAARKSKTLIGSMGDAVAQNERLLNFLRLGIILPPWKSASEGSGGGYAQSGLGLGPGFFLMAVDFPRVLNQGLVSLIAEAETRLKELRHCGEDSLARLRYLQAVVLMHRAAVDFAGRYADLAAAMAETETRPGRKGELRLMADICRRVPENPARSFREALQSFWFIFLMVNPSPTAAAGRFDQYMYPFYKADKDAGRITDEEVLELLECLRIKDMHLNRVSGERNRKKNAGLAKWHNWTIGGTTPDGRDATNELTYLLLEAAKETRLPHHTLTLRVHPDTPEKLMIKALEAVKTGMGMPAFVGDKSYTAYFMRYGIPRKEAREYVLTGCLDANLPGRSRTVAIGMFIVPLVFDIFLHNGVDPVTGKRVGPETGDPESFADYGQFVAAFKKQLRHFMEVAAEKDNLELLIERELFPDAFRSSLMEDGIAAGRDLLSRTMPFENGAVLNPVGMINVADSLAAVKKLVYEDGKIAMGDLKRALDCDWRGWENLRKMCLAAPKYGNGDAYVDSIAADLYAFWVAAADALPTAFGSTHKATAISITSHQPGGALTGATPDGRRAHEILADGTVSPMQGRDIHGPTAVMRSALRIDQDPYQATLMNMKFHPSALESEEDLLKLSALIKTYLEHGGKHVQFNVVSREMLLEAQQDPERYRDLVVRVAGYSAYFTQLNHAIQDEVIARTELSLAH